EVKNFERIKDLFKLDKLKIFFFGYIRKMFSKGLMNAEEKINKYKVFNAIANERQLEFLKNYSFDLIKDINNSIAEDVGKVLSMSLINGETLDNRMKRLKEVFDVNEARLEAIVRTETTRAIEIGEQDGYKQSGLEVKKWILMQDDDRTSDISRALHEKYGSVDKAIPIDENFYVVYKQGKKVKTIDQAIGPFHINERCNVIYEVI
ncbi:MAG: hypothetical protein EOL97_15675, partial [Spirochaetia bacterium]|nr:hypothetical protein [Spirochaetia bacterium]